MPQMKKSILAAMILAVSVLLLSINLGQAEHDREYCFQIFWDQCYDCSLNPDHRFCSGEDIDKETPDPKYAWITLALNNECELYIAHRRYSSTPCSLVVPDNATDQNFRCGRSSLCEDLTRTSHIGHAPVTISTTRRRKVVCVRLLLAQKIRLRLWTIYHGGNSKQTSCCLKKDKRAV